MSNENIQIVVSARDNASRQLSTVRKNIAAIGSKTGGPLGGMIGGLAGISGPAIVAGAAIAGMTAFLKDGIQSAIEEEASLKRLDTALAANIDGWDGNRAAIDAAIESRMRLGFEDDALRDSMIKLTVATQDSEDALRLQALAMDVARGTGRDLAGATDLVLKANMGNIGALRKAGIAIDKNATATEALALLQERYAGQATAYADTTAGAMESAKIVIGELGEDIGAELIPVIKDAALAVRDDLIPALNELGQGLANLDQGARDAGTSINEAIFGSLESQQAGLLKDTVFDSIFDGIHDAWNSLDPEAAKEGGYMQALHFNDGFSKGMENLPRDWTPLPTAAETAPVWRSWGNTMTIQGVAEMERVGNAMAAEAGRAGQEASAELARGILDNRDSVKNAWQQFKQDMKDPFTAMEEMAWLQGKLASRKLKDGLESNDPLLRQQAVDMRQMILDLISALQGLLYTEGVQASNAAERGLSTFNPPAWFRAFAGREFNRHTNRENNGRATGGPVSAGNTYLVGENGPELLHMGNGSGSVTPNHAMGGDIVLNVDGHELFRILDQRMGKRLAMSSSNSYVRG